LNAPEGASRFQFPGLARSLTVYCVGGLVSFYSPPEQIFIACSSQPSDLRYHAIAPELRGAGRARKSLQEQADEC
jgi:hypothetical protein